MDRTGNIYVTDAGNERVQVFTTEGQFLRKWGSFGSGDGQFALLLSQFLIYPIKRSSWGLGGSLDDTPDFWDWFMD